jgi:hypothetical protein
MSQYGQMAQLPAHANAASCGCGNGRENYTMVGRGDSSAAYGACHFPAPPPKRVYCHPAQFSRLASGQTYALIFNAYGSSRPSFY